MEDSPDLGPGASGDKGKFARAGGAISGRRAYYV